MSLKSTRHSVTPPGLSVASISPQRSPALKSLAHHSSWAVSPVTPRSSYLYSVLCAAQSASPWGPTASRSRRGCSRVKCFFHVERCVLKDTIETFIFLSTTYLGGKKKSFSPLSAIKLHHKPSVLYLCRMSLCVRGLYLVIYVSMVPSVSHYLHYYDFIC